MDKPLHEMQVPRDRATMIKALRTQLESIENRGGEFSDDGPAFATFGILAANQAVIDAKLDEILKRLPPEIVVKEKAEGKPE